MTFFNPLYAQLAQSPLAQLLETLPSQLNHWWQQHQHEGNFKQWLKVISHLPKLSADQVDLRHRVSVKQNTPLTSGETEQLTMLLKRLMPWRKGPFSLYGIDINTEWRSDWKWDRVLPHIDDLKDKYILDVGCGSGYHLWRMLGQGAKLAIGIDPMPLYFCQFEAVRYLLGNPQQAHFLPLCLEDLAAIAKFDIVFSMGVLYHRRSPLDHLLQLKNQLCSGGQLVLETLVIKGDRQQLLMPEDRYAQMGNIYFIPTVNMLEKWLLKCGFSDIQCVDINQTTIEEQRQTEWMTTESLEHFLDPLDHNKTIEGYPSPLRAVILARKP